MFFSPPPPTLIDFLVPIATGGDPLKGRTNTTQLKETAPQEVPHHFPTKTKTVFQLGERVDEMFSNSWKGPLRSPGAVVSPAIQPAWYIPDFRSHSYHVNAVHIRKSDTGECVFVRVFTSMLIIYVCERGRQRQALSEGQVEEKQG